MKLIIRYIGYVLVVGGIVELLLNARDIVYVIGCFGAIAVGFWVVVATKDARL